MKILAIRTDKPEAELYLYDGQERLGQCLWYAHRELAETIHSKIEGLLREHGLRLAEIDGIIVYRGPGSFTGLRIGVAVANALARARSVPIVGTSNAQDDGWIIEGTARLVNHNNDAIVIPEYGADPHITQQKK